jgi:cell wall-associated protease
MKPILFFLVIFIGCSKNLIDNFTHSNKSPNPSFNWYYKDPETDSVPEISLYKLENYLAQKRKKQKVIIAILDTGVDLNQPGLKNQFWINKDEIPDNNKDDDQNGYVDDIFGWNFLGGTDENSRIYNHFSSIRYLKYYRKRYYNLLNKNKLEESEKLFLKEYERARNDSIAEWKYLGLQKKYKHWYDTTKLKSDSLLRQYQIYPPYKLKTIDSLFNIVYRQKKDEVQGRLIYFTLDVLKNDRLKGYLKNNDIINNSLNYCLNDNYTERGGRNNFNTLSYGNNKVHTNYRITSHGTEIAGTIASIKQGDVGVKGIFDRAELMILQITPELGSEHETDLINAIYYAVENGAKVINYSSSVNFFCCPDPVYEALSYAEKNDVLFVTSAGNKGVDLDNHITHPRNNYQGKYFSNFLMVGASSSKNNSSLKPFWANYGRKTVDLFAPGVNVLTTWPDNTYKESSGSSISAAIVSGAAAYLMSCFPDLTANEIKECLLTTVTQHKNPIQLTKKDTSFLKPFNQLSSSGGILNIYNAFFKAKSISEQKNKLLKFK